MFTIVRGLHTFLTKDAHAHNFKEQFEKDVKAISGLSIEASYMIYSYYTRLLKEDNNLDMTGKPPFRKFFACLKQRTRGTSKDKRKLNRYYFERRQNNNIADFYDGENKTNCIAMAADSYETNLQNNMVDHM